MSKRQPQSGPTEAPRANRARSVSELLPAVGGAAFRRFGFVQSSIVSRWPEIVGERFARVSAPESLRFPVGKKSEGVLTLTVQGAHAVTIQHVLPEIAERVNRFFGYTAVAKVAIRQGQVAVRAAKAAPSSLRPLTLDGDLGGDWGGLGDSLRTIADPELKAVLGALAAGVAGTSGLPRIGDKVEQVK